MLGIYKCEVCGNVVEMLHTGRGALICCGQEMKLMVQKTEDPGLGEKHVPVTELTESGFKVKVGSVTHPMLPEHHIEWIEVLELEPATPEERQGQDSPLRGTGREMRAFLNPGDSPEATFAVQPGQRVVVREYCNVHGLWKKESN